MFDGTLEKTKIYGKPRIIKVNIFSIKQNFETYQLQDPFENISFQYFKSNLHHTEKKEKNFKYSTLVLQKINYKKALYFNVYGQT